MFFLRSCSFYLTIFLTFFSVRETIAQTENNFQKESELLFHLLQKKHFSPPVINDELSKEIFENFIIALDPHNIYFRESDIKTIEEYKTLLDREISGASWKFLPHVTALYKERLIASEKLFTEILSKPFSYSPEETVSFSGRDTFAFAENDEEYKKWCTKWLKYQTLLRLALTAPESKNSKEVLSGEAKVRNQVKIIESRKIRRVLEHPMGYENYIASQFFNTLSTTFDPHTAYMSKTEFENFQSHLSREGFSFGIELEETDAGEIAVSKLIPGGPAWKSNKIHKGDVLIRVKWQNKSEVDLTGAEVGEVEDIFNESNSEWMDLTFRKINGTTTTVSLIKEKLEEDANIVKSFILTGDKKIGYISLPGFYTEWENFSGMGCATDVAREILKLKSENIEGLILDLRFNGGGSLTEGLNLAGIFINEGPLVAIRMRDEKPIVMKDMNRGTVYDGPLVVMVNSMSASASEIVASTLQDYNRAVIVGSSTYGKATGQILLPIDSTAGFSDAYDLHSPHGVTKVTIEKLYRINGKSIQLKGVVPDVKLPDLYEGFDFREENNEHALPNDSIVKKIYYTPLSPLPIEQLSLKSETRIKSDQEFLKIGNLLSSYQQLVKDFDTFPLEFTAVQKWNKAITRLRLDFETTGQKDSTILAVENLKDEVEVLKIDTYKSEMDALQKKNLRSDIFIEESYRVISDLIELNKK